jgi:3-oxoadipate enol-lactonase
MKNIESQQIIANDITISYTDTGPANAPVIIFIHGFPFNKSMWSRQVETLSAKYRMIAYDVRGHGDSGPGEKVFSIELFVSDLIKLLKGLKIEKTILCGLSMGGYIALNAIVNFPEYFSGLILCDTNCIADTPETIQKRMKAIETVEKQGLARYAEENMENYFAPESFENRKEEIAAVRQMILKTPVQSVINTLLALSRRKETCSQLHRINVPVLILVGEKDKITPPEAATSMQEKIKGSSLGIVRFAAHLSNMENPVQFSEQVIEFAALVNQTDEQ